MDFDRLRRNWENLGRKDPMWAVLTVPGTEGGRWDERAFYATGVETIAWLRAWLAQHGLELPSGPALDFGCGAGRLSFALAPHVESVTGVDVSQPMIEFAAARNPHGERVRLVCNPRDDLSLFADASFAFVGSAIVLQHMRVDYQLRYLAEFLRVLRPGGLLFFQTATRQLRPHVVTPTVEPAGEAAMEIHCVGRDELVAALVANGGELRVEEADDWAGDKWDSMHFAVTRRG